MDTEFHDTHMNELEQRDTVSKHFKGRQKWTKTP
jgi:hypothetical protein